MKNLTTKELILCALFTALIAIGAFIRIPIPQVPFTLQLLFTTLAGLLLGAKLGGISVLVYLFLGLIGLPIFAEGGGFGYLFQPTFGYLIGFAIGAFATGYIAHRVQNPSLKRILVANFAGLFIVYCFGLIYYYLIANYVIHTPIALWPLFLYGFILAVPGDIVICILVAFIARRILPILEFRE
jgi:biotin transport system substrate-specific component